MSIYIYIYTYILYACDAGNERKERMIERPFCIVCGGSQEERMCSHLIKSGIGEKDYMFCGHCGKKLTSMSKSSAHRGQEKFKQCLSCSRVVYLGQAKYHVVDKRNERLQDVREPVDLSRLFLIA